MITDALSNYRSELHEGGTTADVEDLLHSSDPRHRPPYGCHQDASEQGQTRLW